MVVLKKHLQDLSKHRLLGPTLRVPDSVGLEWGPRICISHTFPGNADAAVTLWKPLAIGEPSHQESWDFSAFNFALMWVDMVDDHLWHHYLLKSLMWILKHSPLFLVLPSLNTLVSLWAAYIPHPSPILLPYSLSSLHNSFQTGITRFGFPISYLQYSLTLGNKPDSTAAIEGWVLSLHFMKDLVPQMVKIFRKFWLSVPFLCSSRQ